MREIDDNTYKEVIKEALSDIMQEMAIRIGDVHYIVYINDIQYHEGKLHLDWSTPHRDEKEMLFPYVQEAIIAQLKEGAETIKPQPWYKRFFELFKRK